MVKHLTIGSYLTDAVCSDCARIFQNFTSPYIDFRKIGAIPAQAPVVVAVWISQRLRWRRHSAEGPAPACRRGKARVAAQERFFMCSGERLRLRRRGTAHMKTMALGSAIFRCFCIRNPPNLAVSGNKKCSYRFRWSKIGASVSVVQIIIDIQKIGDTFVFLNRMDHVSRPCLFPSRALPAFFFFIDYLFFFIIIYYTTCHRTAGRI